MVYWFDKFQSTGKEEYMYYAMDSALHYRYICSQEEENILLDYNLKIKKIIEMCLSEKMGSIRKIKYLIALRFPLIYSYFRKIYG
jgi:hypothetical protein